MTEIVVQVPGRDAPGFLKRQRKALALRQVDMRSAGPEFIDQMIDFLLGFVVQPENREEARAALLEASEQEYDNILAVVGSASAPLSSSESTTT